MFDQISVYLTRVEYHDTFKPQFLSNSNDDFTWLQTRATVVIVDFLPESIRSSLYVQDRSYLEALTSNGEVIRILGFDAMVTWLMEHRDEFRLPDETDT